MDSKTLREARDLLMRVAVLLEEDVEELSEKECQRHCACLEEIEAFLKKTDPCAPSST